MKHLGSHARKRRPNGLRGRNRRLGIAAVGILGAAIVAANHLMSDEHGSAPVTSGTAKPIDVRPATSPPNTQASRRLPFEPLVAAQLKRRDVAALIKPEEQWTHVNVAPGDNLSLIFSRLKLSRSDLHTIASLDEAKPHFKRLKPGQLIRLNVTDDVLQTLVVELDELNSLWVERSSNSFTARTETVVPEIRVATASATIDRSLFVDGQKAGLADATIMRLTEIFGWDIDFALDIRAKDYFSVIFEQAYKEGELINQGRILAAEFINQGRSHRAIMFTNENGESSYYSDEGHAMRKAFLRTPVNFSRISSRFNLRRKHPVLNKIRAHKGVDYAAPLGTPIRATANGKITFIGRKGGYGKTVQMQHGQAYSTLYAHMSRFRKGLKRGAGVKQGQIIGYIGKSGLATGPHLHYEFRVNGTHRNPLTVDLPKALPIEKRYLAKFKRHAAPLLSRLDSLVAEHRSHGSQPTVIAQIDPAALGPARTAH